MTKIGRDKTTGWVFDDLFEEGYRFDNSIYKCWVIISRSIANNQQEAFNYLIDNVYDLDLMYYNKIPYQIRIDQDLLDKVKKSAKDNERSVNAQIRYLIKCALDKK